jgi:hypothetical protein
MRESEIPDCIVLIGLIAVAGLILGGLTYWF